MCGIIGILGRRQVTPLLLDGLRRLEYRGYDSAGVATLVQGDIQRRRAEGKIANLAAALDTAPLSGRTGIGHTRWATHGAPTEENAHPHATDLVAVVHNGIIENYRELRESLAGDSTDDDPAATTPFTSDTDTEIVVHLLSDCLRRGLDPQAAVARILPMLDGAFALVMLFAGHDGLMIGARRGSPLAIGYGEGEMYFGSDSLALAPLTRRICYLEEGDWAVIRMNGAEVGNAGADNADMDTDSDDPHVAIFDGEGRPTPRPIVETSVSGALIGKGNYRHFMQKEIHEQPAVIGDTLHAMLNPHAGTLTLPPLDIDLGQVDKITIAACGTAYYAGMVAKYWIEQLARIPVEVDIGSELRYREAPLPPGGLALFISQSGETMDTLAALRYAKGQGQQILSIVNTPESTICRESDAVLLTQAGPEIGVASTKAFTTQLTVLACFALTLGAARGRLETGRQARLSAALAEVPGRIADILERDEDIASIAPLLAEAQDVFYLGRGTAWPIALEGALKLKELSYIHAEGYAAGEMKHGPIALIEEDVPIVVIAPSGPLFEKTASNILEMISRGGKVIVLSDQGGLERLRSHAKPVAEIAVPEIDTFVAPILHAVPMQLLAYHTALLKGTDVDQPRNLAKSVTVE